MSHVPSNTEKDEDHYKSYTKGGGKHKQDYINMQNHPGLTQNQANAKAAKEAEDAAAVKAAIRSKG